MNGYALITMTNNGTFETNLVSGETPIPQTQQDLVNCSIEINNCIQTTECYRKLFTDDPNDFDAFTITYNPIIWAYGTISNGVIQYHFKAEADLPDAIYLEGDITCFNEKTTDNEVTNDNNEDTSKWKIVSIIFIVLSIILLLIAGILFFKARNNPVSSGYIDSSAATDDDGKPAENVVVVVEQTILQQMKRLTY